MPAPVLNRRMTPQEYFAWEETQLERHEYYYGEVFAMAGGTIRHATVIANVLVALHGALRGSGCGVFSGDLRVQIDDEGHYVYPDVSVACGKGWGFLDPGERTLLAPTLIVEVTSPPTEQYDRTGKLTAYRHLASLQEIVLVAHDRRHVEVHRRAEGGWMLVEAEGGATAALESVGAALALDEVYAGAGLD